MKAVLFAAGELEPGSPWLLRHCREGDLIVAVDGGLQHSLAYGCIPDLFVGDLDSARQDDLNRIPGVRRQLFEADKDRTDLELAADEALGRGADELLIAGALGGRPDHSLANQLLAARIRRQAGVRVCLAGAGAIAWPLAAGDSLDLPVSTGSTFSLLALEPGCRVSVTGARYPLAGAELPFGSGLGVSNVSSGSSRVSVESGLIMAMVLDSEV